MFIFFTDFFYVAVISVCDIFEAKIMPSKEEVEPRTEVISLSGSNVCRKSKR